MNSEIEEDKYFWQYVDKCSHSIKSTIRKIIGRLEFVDAVDDGLLFSQLQRLKDDIEHHGCMQKVDKRLIRKSKEFLYDEGENLIPIRAEFAIYRLVASRLQKSRCGICCSTCARRTT